MEKFAEILKDLKEDVGLSLEDLAEKSGVSAKQYSVYLRGVIPRVEVSIRIAKFFNCTLDYLFGLSDDRRNKYRHLEYNKGVFLKKYDKVLKENGTSNYKFAREYGFAESNFRGWKNDKIPSMPTLIIIARELSCSLDWLLSE